MGNVARQKLDEEHVHAPISETEDWVREGQKPRSSEFSTRLATPSRTTGISTLASRCRSTSRSACGSTSERGSIASLRVARDLRRSARQRQDCRGDGCDGPRRRRDPDSRSEPGSGPPVGRGRRRVHLPRASTGRTVPRRAKAGQTGNDRHVPDRRDGPPPVAVRRSGVGLVVFDECQHVPSDVYRRSTHLQSRNRLGLSASPIREDDRQTEIFTLVGPPIGTDWQALFDAGFVAEPELEIRYVPWGDEEQRNAYVSAEGRKKYRIAAENRGKVDEVSYLLSAHPNSKALVFVDYLEQGWEIAAALDVLPQRRDPPPRAPAPVRGVSPRRTRPRDLAGRRRGDRPPDGGSRDRRLGSRRLATTGDPAGWPDDATRRRRARLRARDAGTREEEFARRQLQHLGRKGMTVRERTVDSSDES